MSYGEKLMQIDALKQQIDSHGKLPDDVLKKVNYKFRLEWNYTSNSMEGNSLTKSETRSVMIGNITVNGKPMKDILEMQGHDAVIKSIIQMGKGELNISEKRIKEIHRSIMHEEDHAKEKMIGVWKTNQNYLHNYKGERFDFVAPADVPERMHALINWLNTEKEKIDRQAKNALHPITLALQFHLDYVTIHPFYDGNGRTSRILTNLILIAYGYAPIYIKENERGGYYQYLADIQGYGGAPDVFYDYMAGLLLRSQQLVSDAVEGKDIEEPGDIDKEIALIKSKISSEKPNSSPQFIYKIFQYYDTDVWPLLERTTEKINVLFSESKTFHKVNRFLEEKIEPTDIFKPFNRFVNSHEKKIFGHDIYKENISSVEWKQIKYGLKGTSSLVNYNTILDLNFYKNEYEISLKVKSSDYHAKEIFSIAKNYDQLLLLDETNAICELLIKHLVKEISKDTDENK